MAAFGLFVAQTTQSCPGDVTLTGDAQHTGAQQTRVNRQRHKGDGYRRQNDVLPAAVTHRG
ncbi:hypothetical protein ExPUPEC57_02805 [Escherichia coli]|nr:hypothetical protein ExPUPEC57_02805 [Escherichia coli]